MATNKRLIKSNDDAAGGASFNTVTYTADGAVTPITGVGFQPDFVWIKGRTLGSNHQLTDVVRTAPNCLGTNGTGTETTRGVQSFDSDGFTLQVFPNENGDSNTSGEDYVAWCWKAGGAAVTNTDGDITSQVSANTEAGFSIVSYTGTGSAENIGHGLGVAPSIYIIKNRDAAFDWTVLTNIIDGSMDFLFLNQTAAAGTASESQPTSTTFNEQGNTYVGALNNKYIAYCFAEVAGFSKFGSYAGNSGNNPITDIGFQPAFVMIKRTNSTGSWNIIDNKRGDDNYLSANLSNAEGAMTTGSFDLTATGFTLNNSFAEWNASGSTYIYMAFANQF